MLEARPSIANPRVAQLLERLQSRSERWYRRGYEDGQAWAVDHARRQDFYKAVVMTHLMDEHLAMQGDEVPGIGPENRHPMAKPLFYAAEKAQKWVLEDFGLEQEPEGASTGGDDVAGREQELDVEQARVEMDLVAYVKGWRDALVDLWQTVSPALK